MRHRLAVLSLALILITGCGTVSNLFSPKDAERAMVTLTALQHFRHESASAVAEAYVAGLVSVEQAQKVAAIDSEFRETWQRAAHLVVLWRASGDKPPGIDELLHVLTGMIVQIEEAKP